VNVFAQDEPCKPDCPNSDWQPLAPAPAQQVVVTICGKPITISYRYRIACNTWYDYYIEGIGAGMWDIRDCITNTYGNLNNFMQEVTRQLIILNPANFPPLGNGCEDNWRVMKGSCWTVDWVLGGVEMPASPPPGLNFPEIAYPCTTTECCLEFYRVCIENGQRVITQSGIIPPADPNCQGRYIPGSTWRCQPVCGSIYR
jgi:hypothetical protein